MATDEARTTALALLADGRNVSDVARTVGVARSTVRYWRGGGGNRRSLLGAICDEGTCPWLPPSAPAAYAYMLGLYLGDGCISRAGRTERLRIFLDDRYPGIQGECMDAVQAIAGKPAHRGQRPGHSVISSYSCHWVCLFPQHGPGKKHMRQIALTAWQRYLADEHPGMLLRGLIHSDGYRELNPVKGKDYPRYGFSNKSEDIHLIFRRAADRLELSYTVKTHMTGIVTLIARRPAVAIMDQWVGAKF